MYGKSIILIVDDSEFGRETLGSLLATSDYVLYYAANGPEALALADKLIPDLVLLDVMMPGMNGFDVCRRLRNHPQLAEVPVILVTALDDRSSRLEGLDAGADDFISKPVDWAELRVRVRTVTRLNRYRKLLNERSRFDWVVEQAQEGYLLLGEQGEVHYANLSARHLLDLPLLPAPASLYELVRRHFRCEPEAAWREWFAPTGQPPTTSLFLVRTETPTSPVLWLEVSVLAQDVRFGTEQLVQVRNVTAQISSQRDSWAFHAMIMHKLNTPLQTVVGGLELLAPESIGDLSSNEISVLAELAHKGAQRLSAAIADILQYVKAPTVAREGQGMLLTDIPALVSQISNQLGFECIPQAETSLAARRVRISTRAAECIFWELLENAEKFHPTHAPTVQMNLALSEGRLRITLMDDGLTLSPDQLAKVWLPYYQVEKYFTGEMPGMGLGLSMVATIVWEAGGQCQLSNRNDGPGIVVQLWLPLD